MFKFTYLHVYYTLNIFLDFVHTQIIPMSYININLQQQMEGARWWDRSNLPSAWAPVKDANEKENSTTHYIG